MLRKVVFICFLVLTVAWLGFIFSNSLDSGKESSEKSATVTEVVNTVLEDVGVQEPVTEKSVRTFAHFWEFFVLTLLISADILLCPLAKKFPFVVSLISPIFSLTLTFLLACVDELIQRSSAGRATQFSDVLTDTLGGLCAAVIFALVYFAVHKIKLKKTQK